MIKTPEELKKMRVAGKILASVAKEVLAAAKEGMALRELDIMARDLIRKAGG
jgi:methionine aminopeptidase